MSRLIWASVRGHFLRFVLTSLSVMLGVSLVTGTFVLTDSISKTFDALSDTASAGVDVQVRGVAGSESFRDQGPARAQLPLTFAGKLDAVDGVASARPDLVGSALLVGKDGTAIRVGGAPTFGFGYAPKDPSYTIIAGQAPTAPGQIAVEAATLRRSGLSLGDTTKVVVGQAPTTVKIVGEAKYKSSLLGATAVLLDPATATKAYAPSGKISSFTVVGDAGVPQAVLRDRITLMLPRTAEALTGAEVAQESRDQIDEALGFIRTFLFVFAFVSLFVGGFIIFNTFTMLVAQRTRELALVRAVGGSRSQVVRLVLAEAIVVGIIGAALGFGLGLALAGGLQSLFKSQFDVQLSQGLPIAPRTVIATLVVGVVITLISAVFPAVRASRVPAVAAMRDDIALPVRSLVLRGVLGVLAIAAAAGLIWVAIRGESINWWVFGLAALVMTVGTIMAAPLVTKPVIWLVGTPFALITSVVGRLSRQNGMRNPRRTASTAAALMIGLALISAISVVASSTKASVSDIVAKELTTDFVLNGGQQPFPHSVAEKVDALPGVKSVASLSLAPVVIKGQTTVAAATDAQALAENVKMQLISGSIQALDNGQLLISDKEAKDRGWSQGSIVNMTVGSLRNQQLIVGGIFKESPALGGGIGIPYSLYEKAMPPTLRGDVIAYVKAKPGTDTEALRKQLNATVKPFVTVSVQDGDEFVDSQAEQVNTLLMLIYVLLALSVIIAILGIVNTLALSVFERTREIGLLRAVGLSRGQLSGTITLESIATAIFGAVLGTCLGIGLGVALRYALRTEGLTVLQIPWNTISYVLIAAAIAGFFAALLPALRAVRLDVLKAITTE